MPLRQFPDCLINCDIPKANAGPDQKAEVGSVVQLDGSQSTDPLQRPITFQWTVVTQPPGSAIVLNQGPSSTPSFTPSVPGVYWFSLWTHNQISSDTDSVRVDVTRTPQIPLEKPTLVLENIGSHQYKLKLLSPKGYQNSPLLAVSHLSLKCDGLSHGTGLFQTTPTIFSLQQHHSLSLVGAIPTSQTTLPITDLYSFECPTQPKISLGSTTTIAYARHPPSIGASMNEVSTSD